jgi:RNA polymerase primary sigma factor
MPLAGTSSLTISPGSLPRRLSDMSPAEPRPIQVPPRLIETINKLVRTSRQMLTEIGREPTLKELAERLAISVEKVSRLKIARAPINLEMPTSGE